MITADVWLRGGTLSAIRIDGHAGKLRKGADPVCASVSLLVRSAARLLAGVPAVRITGSADREGTLGFSVEAVEANGRAWLDGVSALLLQGLRDVAAETPAQARLIEHKD